MQLQAPQFWEAKNVIAIVLWPISLIYQFIILVRKYCFKLGVLKSKKLPVAVIIVGNLRVGGTGKTPSVIALAKALYWKGFSPAIISRGYRSELAKNVSKEVLVTDSSKQVGDEAFLIAEQVRSLNIPVWIGSNRYQSGSALLQKYPTVNVIISDDGLQHYQLKRHCARDGGKDIEIIVSDDRGNGNGLLLPAGPLRETSNRERDLNWITQIITSKLTSPISSSDKNTFVIPCQVYEAYQLVNSKNRRVLSDMLGQRLLAVAGIANPEKFFKPLKDIGLDVQTLPLEDHADFSAIDFKNYSTNQVDLILMTEKDAVKCRHLNDERIWVVPLEAELPKEMLDIICKVLQR